MTNGGINRQPALHKLIQRCSGHTHHFGDPLNRHATATPNNIGPLISALNPRGAPPAIHGLVIPFRVNAIKRHAFRPLSHVFQEALKVIYPLFAHRDAAPTVSEIVGIVGIKAALFRGLPRAIRRRACETVRSASARQLLPTQTAAAFRVSRSQFMARDNNLAPAFAKTNPFGATAIGRGPNLGAPGYRERSVDMASSVNEFRHMMTIEKKAALSTRATQRH